MPSVDQFESMFRAAERDDYRYESVPIRSVLAVTDRDEGGARAFGELTRRFLRALDPGSVPWRDVNGSEFASAGELLELVESARPDLICTYRNLHSNAWRWPYGLGTHLDVLTQHTDVPVMVLPHPEVKAPAAQRVENTDRVMAITDNLHGDDRLVNYALRLTAPGGTLWLTHVEDAATFDRYMKAIAKIPSVDTTEARRALRSQLLLDPQHYISRCIEVFAQSGSHARIESVLTYGSYIAEYRSLIEKHDIDLLVLRTKNEDQLAMHGIAYGLAVELRHVPMLLL